MKPVSRSVDRETFQFGGIQARILVSGEDTGGAFAIVEAPIAPKVLAGPLHTHHREDAFWYVIEGEFAAQIGEQEVREGPGAIVFAPKGVPHTYWNPGGVPGMYLESCWPAGLERYLERLGRIVGDGGDGALDAVIALSQTYGIEMHWESIEPLTEKHGVGFGV
jgi:mannose-6-phosphate isomerase-like protein (cupin superfamily)